ATRESTPGESTALNVLRPTLRELRERPVTPGTRGLTSPLREPERADFTTADRSVRHRPPELFGGGRKPRGGEGLWHLHPLPIPAGPARRVPRAGHQPKLTSRESLGTFRRPPAVRAGKVFGTCHQVPTATVTCPHPLQVNFTPPS